MSDRIFIRGVQIHAFHGVFEEEKRLGQRFVFDLDYWLEAKGYAQADDFGRAVSYNDVYETLVEVVKGPTVDLIEALAERIAQTILERFPAVTAVRVEVHKPSAPIAGVLTDVGVEIIRRRGEA